MVRQEKNFPELLIFSSGSIFSYRVYWLVDFPSPRLQPISLVAERSTWPSKRAINRRRFGFIARQMACSHVTIRVGGDFYFDDEKIDASTLSNFLFVDQLRKRATKTKSSLHARALLGSVGADHSSVFTVGTVSCLHPTERDCIRSLNIERRSSGIREHRSVEIAKSRLGPEELSREFLILSREFSSVDRLDSQRARY